MRSYLVQAVHSDGDVTTFLATAPQIIAREDATDYTEEKLAVFDISEFGKVKPLRVCGCWHKPEDPLYIKVVNDDGDIVFDGYGKDH